VRCAASRTNSAPACETTASPFTLTFTGRIEKVLLCPEPSLIPTPPVRARLTAGDG
jgi:hypothetical protein